MKRRRGATLVASLLLGVSIGCDRRATRPTGPTASEPSAKEGAGAPATAVRAPSEPSSPAAAIAPAKEGKTVRFAWRPAGADEAAYAMQEPEDQHRVVILGRAPGGSYPVLIAMHGQPKRAQSPRDYSFLSRVIEVTSRLVQRGQTEPLVLALPVFRFRGVNWPSFDLSAFRGKIEQVLAAEGLAAKDYYVVGHSAAAGCGGDGMNRAHRLHPAAVGFFDTCLGSAWRDEVRALGRARVPTSILQTVETAGVEPRHLPEYDGRYDFARVFRSAGLAATECRAPMPDVPLRSQAYRCAADESGLVRAFVVDTGDGEEAHNALIPTALTYFLSTYLAASR